MRSVHKRSAFTVVDLVAGVVACGTLMAIAGVAIGKGQPVAEATGQDAAGPDAALDPAAKAAALRARDVSYLRGILQGHIVWSATHGDKYPLPSVVDVDNRTVRDIGAEKDTTANINSLLVYNGYVPPALLVSPLEANTAIVADADYVYTRPAGAVDPERALWDPALAADFSVGEANVSYAHLQPTGRRAERWGSTFQTSEPVIGDRAPEVESVERQPDGAVVVKLANRQSKTLLMFGDGVWWSGNLGYNDGSVRARERALATGAAYATDDRVYAGAEAKDWPDIWCYDEPDDGEEINDYLGIFVRGGSRPELFKAIWD